MLRVLALLTLLAALGPAVAAPAADARPRGKAKLTPFTSCQQLVGYARKGARRTRGRTGPGLPVPRMPAPVVGGGQEGAGGVMPLPVAAAPGAGDTDTGPTNVQEAGVDEPDIVKTRGGTVLALVNGALHAVDASGPAPRLVGRLELADHAQSLLVHGDRALVLAERRINRGRVPLEDAHAVLPAHQHAVLTEVDIADPAAMRVVRTEEVDGSIVSARRAGAHARVVVVTRPHALGLPEAARARASRWLPASIRRTARSSKRVRRPAVACDAVRRPARFSGSSVLTVLTVDMAKGLPSIDADAIMSDAQTVYGSSSSLYVATQRWLAPTAEAPDDVTTQVHRFEADGATTTYRASGELPGYLLNQFSLSEHAGALRVAVTDRQPWMTGGPASESAVAVLRERDGRLAEIGRVGGLGRGERIYAVRFVGDVGFLVTFRQTDPLYTLDLADPASPKVVGELKIPGYSGYLHPVGDDLLLGVGQDATETGRRLGAQVSLFDIADLRSPTRIAQWSGGAQSYSEAEADHHAFLHDPGAGLVVIPLARYGGAGDFSGAVALRVSRAGITEAAAIQHPGERWMARVLRSLVLDGRLLTVSGLGVQAAALQTLSPTGFAAFPATDGRGVAMP